VKPNERGPRVHLARHEKQTFEKGGHRGKKAKRGHNRKYRFTEEKKEKYETKKKKK